MTAAVFSVLGASLSLDLDSLLGEIEVSVCMLSAVVVTAFENEANYKCHIHKAISNQFVSKEV